MFEDPLLIVVAVAVLAVLIVLMIGIGGFAAGGEFNKKYSNKLMRLRVISQAAAVIVIILFVIIRSSGD